MEETRLLGFVAAETIAAGLGSALKEPLNFNYTPNDDTRLVQSVWQRSPLHSPTPDSADAERSRMSRATDDVGAEADLIAVDGAGITAAASDSEDDPDEAFFGGMDQHLDDTPVWAVQGDTVGGALVDSDDDVTDDDSDADELQPFAMPDDSRNLNATHVPIYVRDVVLGLRSKDDPEQFECALQAAPGVIATAHERLPEVAVDFAATLLHLGDDYALPGFGKMKRSALVALMVACPALVGR